MLANEWLWRSRTKPEVKCQVLIRLDFSSLLGQYLPEDFAGKMTSIYETCSLVEDRHQENFLLPLDRLNYRICGTLYKMKMQYGHSNIIKSFQVLTTKYVGIGPCTNVQVSAHEVGPWVDCVPYLPPYSTTDFCHSIIYTYILSLLWVCSPSVVWSSVPSGYECFRCSQLRAGLTYAW